jgi:hypothetical protein
VRLHDMAVTFFQIASQSALFRRHLLSHRDDVPRISALRPDHNHHASAKMADHKHSQFAVVPAIVGEIQRIAAKDLRCALKSSPRSASVVARLTGSQVTFIYLL